MNEEEQQNYLRAMRELRDIKLRESDWTQIPDVPLPNKEEWAIYREALRNFPSTINFDNIESVNFPQEPTINK